MIFNDLKKSFGFTQNDFEEKVDSVEKRMENYTVIFKKHMNIK